MRLFQLQGSLSEAEQKLLASVTGRNISGESDEIEVFDDYSQHRIVPMMKSAKDLRAEVCLGQEPGQ